MRSTPAPATLLRRDDSRRNGAGADSVRSARRHDLRELGRVRGRSRLSPPDTALPATFVATAAKTAKLRERSTRPPWVDPSQWWRALRDRELESLIDRAVAASPTLEIALNRLQEARAQEAVVVGTALPMLEGSEGGALGTGSDLARGRASPGLRRERDRIYASQQPYRVRRRLGA